MSNITRYEPFTEFEDLFRRMQKNLGSSLQAFPGWAFDQETMTRAEWRPVVDVTETPEAFQIHAELPDVKKEDIKISVHDGVLSLSGERKFEREEKNKKVHRVERSYGRFERSFTLPGTIDENKVAATYNNGLLTVMVPKSAPAQARAREVKVT